MAEIAAQGGILGNSPGFAIVWYASGMASGLSEVGIVVHPPRMRSVVRAAKIDPGLRDKGGNLFMISALQWTRGREAIRKD
jgi:hypothetical protein